MAGFLLSSIEPSVCPNHPFREGKGDSSSFISSPINRTLKFQRGWCHLLHRPLVEFCPHFPPLLLTATSLPKPAATFHDIESTMRVTKTLALPGQIGTTTAWMLADVACLEFLRIRMGAADNSGSQRGNEDNEVAFHGGGWGW